MDNLTTQQRSDCMSRIKGKNTSLEKIFRKSISALNIRGYRLHVKIPGRPDIYFPSRRIAVFVDGCFWHGCPRCDSRPATNKRFWRDKIEKNRRRDETVRSELRKAGIKSVRFWGHEVKGNPGRCALRLQKVLVSAATKDL
jgi:DNA mismatch endonuclease, patch repair protein